MIEKYHNIFLYFVRRCLIGCVLLPLYLVFCLLVCFLCTSTLGSLAAPYVLASALIALVHDMCIVQVAKCLVSELGYHLMVSSELSQLHYLLREKVKWVFERVKGGIETHNSLIQHFNPACRAARLLPALPVCRLLMSLSDFDLAIGPLPHNAGA